MTTLTIVSLLVVFPSMILEARRARRNERVQRTRGGVEPAGDVYGVMQVAYPTAFLAMIVEGAVRGSALNAWAGVGLVVFAAAKAIKWWAIATLGPCWTFRVIVVPGLPLVRSGPYRWLSHPNYVAVIGELAGVAVMTQAPVAGILGTVGFGLLISKRIAVERCALDGTASVRSPSHERETDVRAALAAWLVTRAGVLLAGYLAVATIGFPAGAIPSRFSENEALNLQDRWDAGWYLGIAMNGYDYRPENEAQGIAFFPAFPMTVRLLGRMAGDVPLSYVGAGTFVSLAAFLCALIYVFRLARDLLGDRARATWGMWLLASYPFAVFYGAIYTESLFLLGVVGAFYHFRRDELARAAVWGLLVGLTRPNGCLLAIPLVWLALRPGGAGLVRRLAVAAAPGAGLALYSVYIWHLTGGPLTWATSQAAWGRGYRGLTFLLTDQLSQVWEAGLYGYVTGAPFDALNTGAAVVALAVVWPVARRLGPAYALFILLNILPPVLSGSLMSLGRYSAVLFPAFIWLGSVVPARRAPVWIAAFMGLQALTAALFYTWRPLY